MADVVAVVRTADLSKQRAQELIAALNTVGRALGNDLEKIPSDPLLLGRRLAEANPLACNVTLRRWNNVRSLVRAALALAVPVASAWRAADLTPEWGMLRGMLGELYADARRYADISGFMRFCSGRGITPVQVNEVVFEAFRASLSSSLRKRSEETYANCCRTWNKAGEAFPTWPAFRVFRASRRVTWTLAWDTFPASLRKDAQAWLDRLAGVDLTMETFRKPVRPGTLKIREYQLRSAASALVLRGREPASIGKLADLVEIESFKEILRYLIDRRDGSARGQVGDIASLLKSVAQFHVGIPKETLDAMAGVIRRISHQQGRQQGLTELNRRRLRPFDEPENVRALVGLPERLLREARRTRPPVQAALLVQTALAIELLLLAPMRLANLAALDIGLHIQRIRNSKEVSIVIQSHEVKNSVLLDFPLPATSVALLDVYIQEYRPLIATAGSTAVFPGRAGKPKGHNTLRQQISQTILRYAGLTINPHLFRHITAKLYLDQNPGAYEVVRRVLNHRSMKTTTNFYTGLESAAAVRHFDKTILGLRGGEGHGD
ncbi:site-specific integrase [Limobrevibacterium gyesilva]|uniref:Site-specific integrase n=1 Tax=Limobrevibacterium gyesilva TaxID=2991712 RepID=A0AA42CKE8_9PROT|nr:site-specific integrase [Limobrevibacterium gyesilva]MCW3477770.1 site-specific integrase [Limobrevibacterium gyesilva]